MLYNNRLLVFAISFLIGGFFLLFTPESGFSSENGDTPGCCQAIDKGDGRGTGRVSVCFDTTQEANNCRSVDHKGNSQGAAFFPGGTCNQDISLCALPPDHFKCYEVKTKEETPKRFRFLDDQFEQVTNKILEPILICNPVLKDGGGSSSNPAPDSHLTCYMIKDKDFDKRDVTVVNQFEERVLRVMSPVFLCLPSTKED